ncbi:hypothetical protein EG68_09653 [Paragonimus skrjabini miyazakii]|uniref:Uncharacterized protein n=1 Tax=Paragonimus skrjabini miyazakii TaxID=59628 RepID=A0A8S9YJM0_9TREM|nr:hypothetical protein EG68_09653 [Paragonimus skrjabini miyazakii]
MAHSCHIRSRTYHTSDKVCSHSNHTSCIDPPHNRACNHCTWSMAHSCHIHNRTHHAFGKVHNNLRMIFAVYIWHSPSSGKHCALHTAHMNNGHISCQISVWSHMCRNRSRRHVKNQTRNTYTHFIHGFLV